MILYLPFQFPLNFQIISLLYDLMRLLFQLTELLTES